MEKTILGFFILFLCTLSFGQELPLVKVRVLKSQKELVVSGYGLRLVVDQKTPLLAIDKRPSLPIKQKIVLKKGSDSETLVKFMSKDKKLIESLSVKYFQITGELLQVNQRWIPSGSFVYWDKESHGYDVVVKISLEEYLKGVLPSEMPMSWPVEALKAQAIASRSYILSVIKARKNKPFHVESSVMDQVFKYQNIKDLNRKDAGKLQDILQKTQGQYLTFQGNHIYRAFFHADSGGITELAKNVWGAEGAQPSTSVKAPYKHSPYDHWTVNFSKEQFSKILARYFHTPFFQLGAVTVDSRSDARRALELSFYNLENHKTYKMKAQSLRQVLGFFVLKSTQFKVQENLGSITFIGKGFGHGVGLCQWGARYLALSGKNYRNILSYYYPRAQLAQGHDELGLGKSIKTVSTN